MIPSVSGVIGTVLFAIGLLHFYWGMGGVWPGTDQRSCARIVAGFKRMETMPSPYSAFAVTIALLCAAWLALALGGLALPPRSPVPLPLLGILAAFVFLARGTAGYTASWRRLTPEMPFARLDRQYYSPFCLAIGAGLLFLSIEGPAA